MILLKFVKIRWGVVYDGSVWALLDDRFLVFCKNWRRNLDEPFESTLPYQNIIHENYFEFQKLSPTKKFSILAIQQNWTM
jgi:hypothetical protein